MQLSRCMMAVLCAAAVVGGTASAKDGTYTATTLGRNGNVTIQTTIEGDRIKEVKVLD